MSTTNFDELKRASFELNDGKELYNMFKKLLQIYMEFVKNDNLIEKEIENKVSNFCEQIDEIFRLSFEGKTFKSIELLAKTLKENEYISPKEQIVSKDKTHSYEDYLRIDLNIGKTIKSNFTAPEIEDVNKYRFFRSRVSDISLNQQEMGHIPFNKRENIKSQRFSAEGVPCLYMGVSSFVNWLELGMPQKEKFWTSCVEYLEKTADDSKLPEIKPLHLNFTFADILDDLEQINSELKKLRMTSENIDEYEHCQSQKNAILNLDFYKIRLNYRLFLYPIVLATSFKKKYSDNFAGYKVEYCFSKILMEYVNSSLKFNCISYISKSIPEPLQDRKELYKVYTCYAVLTNLENFSKDNTMHSCTTINSSFKIGIPVNYAYLLNMRTPSTYRYDSIFQISYGGITGEYGHSHFYQLDCELIKQMHKSKEG